MAALVADSVFVLRTTTLAARVDKAHVEKTVTMYVVIQGEQKIYFYHKVKQGGWIESNYHLPSNKDKERARRRRLFVEESCV